MGNSAYCPLLIAIIYQQTHAKQVNYIKQQSDIIFKEFHSFDILPFSCKKDLIDSKIYFADSLFKEDWPNMIKGFLAFLMQMQ